MIIYWNKKIKETFGDSPIKSESGNIMLVVLGYGKVRKDAK